MKRMRQSKTMWFSLALVICGALFDNFSYWQSVISERYYGVLLVGIGIIVAILRFLTTGPVE